MSPVYFATAAKGTEPALRDELRSLKLSSVRCDRGGVHFSGPPEAAWKACLHSRICLRVFEPVAHFEAASGRALYDAVRAVDWRDHLTPDHTLAVTAFCRSSGLTHTNFVAQRVKDAIVDQQRDAGGKRSSVDRRDPDVPLFIHLVRDRATLYLDLAGDSLHKRGYRKKSVPAPLKENLAAALLRLGGWNRRRPLTDPMCGSGTIAIEAWQWARRIAPGLSRERFAFERWPAHGRAEQEQMAELREQARAGALREGPEVFAFDVDDKALDATRANNRAAGAGVVIEKRSVFDLEPGPEPGFVATNPPYGQRLAAGDDFYRKLGQTLWRLRGYRIGILLSKQRLQRLLGLKPDRYQIVYNGDLQCRIVQYGIR